MNHKEALQKIVEVTLDQSTANKIATEALQSESRIYSEKEVCGFAEWCIENDYKWHQHFDNPNGGSGVWYHIDDYENTEPIISKELFQKFLQSLKPKTKEVERGWTITDRTVIDKQLEAIKTVMGNIKTKEQAIQFLKDSGIELEEQPTSPLGGKYEAMNNAYKKINSPSIEKINQEAEDILCRLFWGRQGLKDYELHLRELTIKAMEEYAQLKANNSLEELEKVKKIEDWLREYPIDGGVIFVKDLLEYIQLIKQ